MMFSWISTHWQDVLASLALLGMAITLVCAARSTTAFESDTETLVKLNDDYERVAALVMEAIRDRDDLIRAQEVEIAELRRQLKEARKHSPVKSIKEYRN